MPGARQVITLLAFIYWTWGVLSMAIQHNDRSPYFGQPVMKPEALSGLWEASDGKGGAVGIHLKLVTTATGDAKTMIDTPQSWEHLEVGVYERKSAQIEFGEENFFTDSPSEGLVFQNGRLQLTGASFDLDLVQKAGDQWVGRLHRGSFDSVVTLRRPGTAGPTHTSPIVGTWVGKGKLVPPSDISCIHIVQQGENAFMGWSDSVRMPEVPRYSKILVRPALESYGNFMKVHLDGDENVTLELYALNPMCCSHKFVGRLTHDGNLIEGNWPSGPNQTPDSGSWAKIAGDSCVSSVPPRPRQNEID